MNTCKILKFHFRNAQKKEAEAAGKLENPDSKTVETPPNQVKKPGPVMSTPMSMPVSSQTAPATSEISPSTSSTCSSTPRGHGQPCKALTKPSYSDFPVDGSPEEQKHWFKSKVTQRWHYNKLSSEDEPKFKARENAHTKEYYHNRKKQLGKDCEGGDSLDGIEYLDKDDSRKNIKQQQSCER